MKIDKDKKQDSVVKKNNMKFLAKRADINKQHIKIIYRLASLLLLFVLIGIFYFLKQQYSAKIYERKSKKQNEFNKLQTKIDDFTTYIKDWKSFESKNEKVFIDDKNKLIFNGLKVDSFIKDFEDKIINYFDTSGIVNTTERASKDMISNFKMSLFDIVKNDEIDFLREFVAKYNIYNIDKNIILNRKKIIVTFNSNYEYPVYKIISIIKNALPGLLIIDNVSIKPRNEIMKTLYYDYKFKQKNVDENIKDRFNCNITFEWIVLSK